MICRHYENCYIDIYTHDGDHLRFGPEDRPNAVLAASFAKDLAGAFAGRMGITIRWTPELAKRYPGLGLLDVIADDDWIVMTGGDRGVLHTITFGPIDTITKTVRLVDGARIEEYRIQASDFAKVIDTTEVWFCEYGESANYAGAAMVSLIGSTEIGTPDEICGRLVKGFLTNSAGSPIWQLPPGLSDLFQLQLPVADTKTIVDVLDVDNHVQKCRGIGIVRGMVASQFNLSQTIKQWQNVALNELFFDLRASMFAPGVLRPTMIMRERPFPVHQEPQIRSAWGALPAVEVEIDRVTSSSWSRSGVERFTAFILVPETDPVGITEQYVMFPPRLDVPGIKRHGLRKHEAQSRFCSYLRDGSPADPGGSEVRRWGWLLHSWYGPNPDLRSGSIEIRGFIPGLRVGRKLVLGRPFVAIDPDRMTFYIEGVNLSWSATGGWQTAVSVTRGYRGDDSAMYGLIRKHFDDLTYMTLGVTTTAPLLLEPTTSVVGSIDVLESMSGATL